MNTFDRKLPKTTSYRRENELFIVQHNSFDINYEELRAIDDLIAYAQRDLFTKAILIDNRRAEGTWPRDIVKEIQDMKDSIYQYDGVKRAATLTSSVVAAMQINRVAKLNGIEDYSKGFCSDFNETIRAYLFG